MVEILSECLRRAARAREHQHMTDLMRECIEALEVLAMDAAEAGYFVRAEAAADLAFRVRCALAKETLED